MVSESAQEIIHRERFCQTSQSNALHIERASHGRLLSEACMRAHIYPPAAICMYVQHPQMA